MVSPLPLRRLCRMAAMAPALTEAATQARVKLTTAPPGTGVVNGRGNCPSPSPDTPTSPIVPSAHQEKTSTKPQPRPPVTTSTTTTASKEETLESTTTELKNIVTPGIVKNISEICNKEPGIRSVSNGETGGSTKIRVSNTGLGRMSHISVNSATTSASSVGQQNSSHTMSMNESGLGQPNAVRGSNMGFALRTTQQTSTISKPSSTQSAASSISSLSNPLPGLPAMIGEAGPSTCHEDTLQLGLLGDSTTVHSVSDMASSGMSEVGVLTNVDLVAETTKRQKELDRHAECTMRRLRSLQSRQAVTHIQQQLSGVVDHQHKNLQSMAKSMKVPPATSVDLKTELLQSEDVKSLSTAALVNLVRRLQTSQALSLHQRLASQNHGTTDGASSVLKLDEDLCVEMNRVSSTLQLNLHHLESAMDSDATESSSGGESCDEMDYDFDDEKLPKPSLHRRAEWKWAVDHSAVAARWTWLQAQVSDLEYRIRQQGDIYKQIRATKGAVTLGDPPSPEDLMARGRSARTGRKLSPLEEKIANIERKKKKVPTATLR